MFCTSACVCVFRMLCLKFQANDAMHNQQINLQNFNRKFKCLLFDRWMKLFWKLVCARATFIYYSHTQKHRSIQVCNAKRSRIELKNSEKLKITAAYILPQSSKKCAWFHFMVAISNKYHQLTNNVVCVFFLLLLFWTRNCSNFISNINNLTGVHKVWKIVISSLNLVCEWPQKWLVCTQISMEKNVYIYIYLPKCCLQLACFNKR